MSRHWLERAVDFAPEANEAWQHRVQLGEHAFSNGRTENDHSDTRVEGLFANTKVLISQPIASLTVPKGKDSKPDVSGYVDNLVPAILRHQATDGLTLVIVNTVDRAVRVFHKLKESSKDVEVFLIHSRFRPKEREQWATFLNRHDSKPRIVVSTQIVEAGVDISAKVLFTELAPWASLVQRFGRCARFVFINDDGSLRNEQGTVYWMDVVDHELTVLPYSAEELTAARLILTRDGLDDVGLLCLADLRAELDHQAVTLFPYEPRFVPRAKDLFDLFDTTPDLTGADIDISRYIRDGEELDVHVFWREVGDTEQPTKKDRPHRRELCAVPFHRFREMLSALRQAGRIWRRNYRKGWEPLNARDAEHVYPGQVFLLDKSCGGYNSEVGWTGDTHDTEFELPQPIEPAKATAQDDEEDADDLSQINQWLTVMDHTRDVCLKLENIFDTAGLSDCEIKVLRLAARWHDRGKAHAAFQAKLKSEMLAASNIQSRLAGQPAAKAPNGKPPGAQHAEESKNAWRRDKLKANANGDLRRPGFRHELASALGIVETLYGARPAHGAFAWPDGLNRSDFRAELPQPPATVATDEPLVQELAALSPDEVDLLVYVVAAHHGKVRMSLRSSPDDDRIDVPDPCLGEKRQARGVRDDDALVACQIPAAELNATGIMAPQVTLSLDLMELGLSPRYGTSWRERTQLLLERLGPFRLAYLEAMLRAADCRASAEEDHAWPEEKGT